MGWAFLASRFLVRIDYHSIRAVKRPRLDVVQKGRHLRTGTLVLNRAGVPRSIRGRREQRGIAAGRRGIDAEMALDLASHGDIGLGDQRHDQT